MKRKKFFVVGTTMMLLGFGMLQRSYADPSDIFTNAPNLQKVKEEKESEKSLIMRLEMIEMQLAQEKDLEKKKKEKDAQKPSAKISGRVHMGSASFNSNEISKDRAGDLQDGAELRRARLGVSGSWLEQYNYKAEFDFASGGEVRIKDVYGEITQLPLLSDIRLGHFKEGINLDLLTSSNNIWFIERSAISNCMSKYIGDRSLGVATGNASRKENWLWNIGIYRPVEDKLVRYKNDNDGYKFTARTATLLYDNEACGRRLHLGFAYSYNSWDDQTSMNWGGKLENNLSNTLVSTGDFGGTDSYQAFAPELIWTNGPLAVQSEVFLISLDNSIYGDQDFTGGYCQIGYWLTGERFKYEKGRGALGGIEPCENFVRKCENGLLKTGKGAWMLGYRFGWSDLSWMDHDSSGKLYTHTIGLNWQLTRYSRLMFNYNLSDSHYNDDKIGKANAFATAFQVHF